MARSIALATAVWIAASRSRWCRSGTHRWYRRCRASSARRATADFTNAVTPCGGDCGRNAE